MNFNVLCSLFSKLIFVGSIIIFTNSTEITIHVLLYICFFLTCIHAIFSCFALLWLRKKRHMVSIVCTWLTTCRSTTKIYFRTSTRVYRCMTCSSMHHIHKFNSTSSLRAYLSIYVGGTCFLKELTIKLIGPNEFVRVWDKCLYFRLCKANLD
jgi:hypothetical protein